jgi:hypothetical protein
MKVQAIHSGLYQLEETGMTELTKRVEEEGKRAKLGPGSAMLEAEMGDDDDEDDLDVSSDASSGDEGTGMNS